MNPEDLLITNQFITADKPTTHVDQRRKKEYLDLKEFMASTFKDPLHDEQKDFLDDDDDNFDSLDNQPGTVAALNRGQWLQSEKPLTQRSRKGLPILSKTVNDLSQFRYRKQIVSYISIDSRKRNKFIYPNPCNYRMLLNKEFRNLFSIRLESIVFSGVPPPINPTNNKVRWTTSYSGLDGVPTDTLVRYEAQIPPAFYTSLDLVQTVERALNAVPHQIPGGTFPSGFAPCFFMSVDQYSRAISLMQRLEEIQVVSLTTTYGSNEITLTLRKDTMAVPPAQPLPFDPTRDSVPIVLTGLRKFATQVGGISTDLIDNVPFQATGPGNNYAFVSVSGTEYVYTLSLENADGSPTVLASQTVVMDLSTSVLPTIPDGNPTMVVVGRAVSFSLAEDPDSLNVFLGLVGTDQTRIAQTNVVDGVVVESVRWATTGAGELALDVDDYVLMRIETQAKPVGTISSNLSCAIGATDTRRGDVFFAQIVFAGTAPGNLSVRAVGGDRLFYDASLVQLVDLDVQFYDSCGRLLQSMQENSFVLQMVELREVLRDTLIDSRTGNIADTGANITTTNPLD